MAIKKDDRNYRIHSEKNKRIIKKSLEKLGAGRSILIDAEDEVVAGNATFEEATKLKIPVRIIETDGTELIAVKRTDLKSDDERRKELALIDNHATDMSEFDMDMVMEDFSEDMLKSLSMELPPSVVDDIVVDNPDYPLIPKYDEQYNTFVIVCKSKTEEARIRTKLNLAYRARSYKQKFLGETFIVDSEKIL